MGAQPSVVPQPAVVPLRLRRGLRIRFVVAFCNTKRVTQPDAMEILRTHKPHVVAVQEQEMGVGAWISPEVERDYVQVTRCDVKRRLYALLVRRDVHTAGLVRAADSRTPHAETCLTSLTVGDVHLANLPMGEPVLGADELARELVEMRHPQVLLGYVHDVYRAVIEQQGYRAVPPCAAARACVYLHESAAPGTTTTVQHDRDNVFVVAFRGIGVVPARARPLRRRPRPAARNDDDNRCRLLSEMHRDEECLRAHYRRRLHGTMSEEGDDGDDCPDDLRDLLRRRRQPMLPTAAPSATSDAQGRGNDDNDSSATVTTEAEEENDLGEQRPAPLALSPPSSMSQVVQSRSTSPSPRSGVTTEENVPEDQRQRRPALSPPPQHDVQPPGPSQGTASSSVPPSPREAPIDTVFCSICLAEPPNVTFLTCCCQVVCEKCFVDMVNHNNRMDCLNCGKPFDMINDVVVTGPAVPNPPGTTANKNLDCLAILNEKGRGEVQEGRPWNVSMIRWPSRPSTPTTDQLDEDAINAAAAMQANPDEVHFERLIQNEHPPASYTDGGQPSAFDEEYNRFMHERRLWWDQAQAASQQSNEASRRRVERILASAQEAEQQARDDTHRRAASWTNHQLPTDAQIAEYNAELNRIRQIRNPSERLAALDELERRSLL